METTRTRRDNEAPRTNVNPIRRGNTPNSRLTSIPNSQLSNVPNSPLASIPNPTLNSNVRQGIPLNAEEQTDRPSLDGQSRIIRLERDRKYFIVKVYLLAMLLILLSFIPCYVLTGKKKFNEYFRKNPMFTYLVAFGGLILLVFFNWFDVLRHREPINYIFALVIAEFVTFGLITPVLSKNRKLMMKSFLVSLLILLGFTIIGAMLPRDLTLDVVPLTIFSFLLYVLMSIALVVMIITGKGLPVTGFIFVILILVVLYIMYDIQLIVGTRNGMVRYDDYVMASLMVYLSFCLLYIAILIVLADYYKIEIKTIP